MLIADRQHLNPPSLIRGRDGHATRGVSISPARARVLEVAAAFDQTAITRACARELTHVKPDRQSEILTSMKSYKDHSVAFARSLILKTPPALREVRRRKHNPWSKSTQRKSDLIKKLAEAEQKHDFYSRLYEQYPIDLLPLAIYARALLTNRQVREYLDQRHPEIVARFETIIAEAKG